MRNVKCKCGCGENRLIRWFALSQNNPTSMREATDIELQVATEEASRIDDRIEVNRLAEEWRRRQFVKMVEG